MPRGVYKRKSTIDLTGRVFGMRTVIGRGLKKYHWLVRCSCGFESEVAAGDLRRPSASNRSKCRRCQHQAQRKPDGDSHTREYRIWASMCSRCSDGQNSAKRYYFDRGVGVADEWKGPGGFQKFIEHAGRMPTPAHTLDRIDSAKGYEPGNVRWATVREQNRNKRNNRFLTYRGETMCLADWAKKLGLKRCILSYRLKVGWPIDRVLSTADHRFRAGSFRD